MALVIFSTDLSAQYQYRVICWRLTGIGVSVNKVVLMMSRLTYFNLATPAFLQPAVAYKTPSEENTALDVVKMLYGTDYC